MFIYSLLIASGSLFACCEGDKYNMPGEAEPNATITTSVESINAPAEGGVYQITVGTTASEWSAYAIDSWLQVACDNTVSSSGTVTVTVPENGVEKVLSSEVIVMSGTARKHIPLSQAAASNPYTAPEGYELVWHDEFNTGTELRADYWTHEVWGKGTVNDELQYYVNHLSPDGKAVTEIKDGALRINCFKENGKVYSGRVYAKVNSGWTYGYIEASIKLPKGKGTWPAFWMMPVNFKSWPADGEIDIMEEVGGHPNYVSSSLHANAHVHTAGTQVTHEMLCEGAEDGFHTYAILWTEHNITTYVDGQVQLSYDNRGLGRDDWPYDDPFYVILNLAWGGSWGAAHGGVDESALPATMEIDYVRVFKKQ